MSEHSEQAALIACVDLNAGRHPALRNVFAIPNGGARHKAVAGKIRAEGARPGVPDLCLAWPAHGWHGLYIELKVGRNKPSAAQIDWLARLEAAGYRAVVCRGWQAAWREIAWYLDIAPRQGAALAARDRHAADGDGAALAEIAGEVGGG